MSNFCTECGQALQAGWNACPHCGTLIARADSASGAGGAPPAAAPAASSAEAAGGGTAATRVLIADDDEDTRILLAEILADEPGVELAGAASDGSEAISLAGQLQPDVVILDWLMPGRGGAYAARAIKDAQPSVAIIALTGMDPTQASYDMMSAGAIGFLQKGCSSGELIDTIRSVTRW